MLTPHVAYPMADASQVGEARRAAAQLAASLGFGETAAGRLALIVTELGNNLVRHARGGRLLIGARDDGATEVIAIDDGPGMADVQGCMADGYSTRSTPGTGLGAVRRLADQCEVYSQVPSGTVLLARVRPEPLPRGAPRSRFQVGVVNLAAPGELISGDAWAWAEREGRASLLMADGLGHGPLAAEAGRAAVEVFDQAPFEPGPRLMERAHARLRSTRGAAVAVLAADADANALRFCGIGNVAGRVISGTHDRSLLSQHGTVGLQMRAPQDQPYEWPEHALLVLHSDGLASRWTLKDHPGVLQFDPTVVAALLVRDHCRGRDDVTVAVLRRAVHH